MLSLRLPRDARRGRGEGRGGSIDIEQKTTELISLNLNLKEKQIISLLALMSMKQQGYQIEVKVRRVLDTEKIVERGKISVSWMRTFRRLQVGVFSRSSVYLRKERKMQRK